MKRRTRDFRAWLVEAISWYDASAELFMPKRKGGPRRPIGYCSLCHGGGGYPLRCRGFSRHSHARAWMQVGDERFDSDDIRRLYESSDYPRRRRKRQLS